MKYCAADIAVYIVEYAIKYKHPISNLQLQRFLYILQITNGIYKIKKEMRNNKKNNINNFIEHKNNFLLFNDVFEAWPHGPVIPFIYKQLNRYYGSRVISSSFYKNFLLPFEDEETKNFIDKGISSLLEISSWNLIRITNNPESPWGKIYKNGEGLKRPIPNRMLLEFAYNTAKDSLEE